MSSSACCASSAEKFSLPNVVLTAISVRETAPSSNILRITQSCSRPPADPIWRLHGKNQNGRIEEQAHSLITPFEEIIHFLIGQRFPPIRVNDLNFPLQRSEFWFLACRRLRAHDIHHRHAPAADRDRLPSSTALISSGSLFLASATLTCMAFND